MIAINLVPFRTLSLLVLLIALFIPADAQARNQLAATYTATMVESEFRGIDSVDPEKLAGIWLVQFLPGEALSIILNGEIVAEGDWALKDDVLTLTQMSGSLVCAYDGADTAIYRVSIRGFSVSFEKLTDECPERTAVLTRGVFRASAK
jgi:hypothetical protein